MKRFLLLLPLAGLLIASCADSRLLHNPETGKMEVVEPYGLFNTASTRNPNVVYDVSAGTVICSIVFFQTIFVPVIGIGYKLWQPVAFTNTNRR